MTNQESDASAFVEALLPYAATAAQRVKAAGSRFAYYTTAETAIKVLKHREIWMRNTRVMNDYMEVDHGLECLQDAYHSDAGGALKAALEKHYPGISAEFEGLFNAWIPSIRSDTYVTCVSEHSPEEDRYGRLSMWRAYGGAAGVALILNGGVMLRPSEALGAYSSPVAYHDRLAVRSEMATAAARISRNPQLMEKLGREGAKSAVFHMLRFAAVCTKHPAFSEEREWRVVAMPSFEQTASLKMDVECIGSIPQRVLKIPLADQIDKGLHGLEPSAFVERVLIGPSDHAATVGQALHDALISAGIENPEDRIVFTGIPIRPNQR